VQRKIDHITGILPWNADINPSYGAGLISQPAGRRTPMNPC